jgi:hypothetical protein
MPHPIIANLTATKARASCPKAVIVPAIVSAFWVSRAHEHQKYPWCFCFHSFLNLLFSPVLFFIKNKRLRIFKNHSA